ncbi:MAG: class I SAM-dependent methyltransferase [Actinomycetota bacterium]|jgi:ubiquinone/menaquinone biosynthesis C-methylase UbiE|nr:class I SAM-dependent methyltransferase [Actinomycetota bacterium]MDA8279109.1 class I SAM-dependent methyltransferase [Actinomycetota bacterium]
MERSTSGPTTTSTAKQSVAIHRQRRVWEARARNWNHHASNNEGLRTVVAAVVDTATSGLADGESLGTVVDLGCGSGQLTLALAKRATKVLGVDVSGSMLRELEQRAAAEGITNVECLVSPIERLSLPPGSVDVVVSNYALHHLRDPDKGVAVAAAAGWLRPGGRLVIGDMMLGRGADAADRAVIADKVRQLARRGPGGWWRVAKNAVRFVVRIQERPLSRSAWVALVQRSGFVDVQASAVVHEAAVVSAVRAGGPTTEARPADAVPTTEAKSTEDGANTSA